MQLHSLYKLSNFAEYIIFKSKNLFYKSFNMFRKGNIAQISLLQKHLQTCHKFKNHSSSCLHLSKTLFPYMPPMVLEWSSPNEQFQTRGNTQYKYWPWYMVLYMVTCFIGFGSCVDVVIHLKESGPPLAIMAFGFGSLSLLLWSSATVFIWNIDEIVLGFRYLNTICRHNGSLIFKSILKSKTR